MARIYPLFSSSSGNCTYIGDSRSGVLIDAGVSCKKILTALADNNIPPEAVKGIFVTHVHSDHISGLKVLSKKLKVPVYSQEGSLKYMLDREMLAADTKLVALTSGPIEVCGFEVTAFDTPHDTAVSCGFTVAEPSGRMCAVCTDLGRVTDEIHRHLALCDLVLLEANYDVNMLKNGPYSYDLKMRIASDHGHLSNTDCGKELCALMRSNVSRFVLGHLSPHNNTPQVAENSVIKALCEFKRGDDYLLTVARAEGSGAVIF